MVNMSSGVSLFLTSNEASFIMDVSSLLYDHKSDYEKGLNPNSSLSYKEVCKLIEKLEKKIGL